MSVASPPIKPAGLAPTAQTARRYYTLHYNKNNAFTMKLSDDVNTAIVGFRKIDDAARVGNMVETYFIDQKEWPDMHGTRELLLPQGRLEEMVNVYIHEWDFDELKLECTRNFIDFISVDKLVSKNTSYSLQGALYAFEATPDFYRKRLSELYIY